MHITKQQGTLPAQVTALLFLQLACIFTFQVVEKPQEDGLLAVWITEAVWQVLHGGKNGSPIIQEN
ncbi:MAG: hypothetical protein K6A68_04365 [Clostridiales bacterium]|nr:hypothetical protein [Clostridiales bacterium]